MPWGASMPPTGRRDAFEDPHGPPRAWRCRTTPRNIHVLAEHLAIAVVGVQAALRVPAMRADVAARALRLPAVFSRARAVTVGRSSAAPCRKAPSHIAVMRQLPLRLPQDGKWSRSSHFWPAQSMKFHCGFLPNNPCALRCGSNQASTRRMRGRCRTMSSRSGCSSDQSASMPTHANENVAMTLGRASDIDPARAHHPRPIRQTRRWPGGRALRHRTPRS